VKIPALTLWRPWPAAFTALAPGLAKDVENRSWPTRYRGLVYLHAGQRFDSDGLAFTRQVLARGEGDPETISNRKEDHPTGIVAVVDLVDVCPAALHRQSCDCGQWALPRRAHWKMELRFVLPKAVPCGGSRQLWYPPETADAAVQAQLEVAQ